MRFLCDHMLIRLGRWLRAAGYDTAIAEGSLTDRALLEWATREARLLLTRDRKLVELRGAAGRVLVLEAQGVEAAAAALGRCAPVDWLYRPFTRCLIDNAVLAEAPADVLTPEDRAAIPERSRPIATEVRRCPVCARLYWEGGHTRRMRARLERWREGVFCTAFPQE